MGGGRGDASLCFSAGGPADGKADRREWLRGAVMSVLQTLSLGGGV